MSGSFLLLVLVSFAIAAPLSGYLMQDWLQHYDYRVSIPAWIFVATLLLAVGIATLTVSYQAIRAARINPVKSLRMRE
jgi:ABC-type antimicrobial peptide transport system permease subunit